MKCISIIGGGISGLCVLHFLKQRLKDSVDINLYERSSSPGGTIQSIRERGCLFEWGPNGFLDHQPASLQLIEELGITDQLIEAGLSARRRYIQIRGRLRRVPTGLFDFLGTPLLPLKDKWHLIKGFFKKNLSTDCSIHDYVSRRFSPQIAEDLVDPFISGIYAGDIRRLHMASAFPKFKKARMRSFVNGMGQMIDALYNRHQKNIQLNSEISSLPNNDDIQVLAVPAYAAAKIVESRNADLAQLLNQMPYAPVTVAGLLFNARDFKKIPDGFGYLIASKEKKDVLGVLIESNVYSHRAGGGQVMVRVMFGGSHHPDISKFSDGEIIAQAIREIDQVYGITANPQDSFIKQWPKAIPQYELDYPRWRQSVSQELSKISGLYLCANYLDGVSFNDCINNAKLLSALI